MTEAAANEAMTAGVSPDVAAPTASNERDIFLTVAICTHNHKDRLQRTLAGLRKLEAPSGRWELLVVDNACTDGSAELIAGCDWRPDEIEVRTVREGKLGVSHARNRALTDARGEYIVFMDDDETPDPHWLRAYEQAMRAERPDALGGRIEVLFEARPPLWLQDELLGFLGKLDHGATARRLTNDDTPIFTGNCAFRRDVFGRVGAFDTSLGRRGNINAGGEDTEMYRRLLRMGCTVWWVPDAIIYHRVETAKLQRRYFLDLHYRMGKIDGSRRRGEAWLFPPGYLLPQLWRALRAALGQRFGRGRNTSLRKEMNVAYFIGVILGWMRRTRPRRHTEASGREG